MTTAMIVSGVIFVITFIFILFEKNIQVHRAVIAMGGAALMILFGSWFHFYNYKQAFAMVDIDTITLLFSMMFLMAIFEDTGAFEFLSIKVARLSRGNGIRLLLLLGLTTSILSMFLDNVTTVVLIAPVTLLITTLLGYSPIPFLLSEAVLSNIAGAATLVGDPPNIMVSAAVKGMTFMKFIKHMTPLIVLIWIVAFCALVLIFRKELIKRPKGLRSLLKMDPQKALTNPKKAKKLTTILLCVVALFFVAEHFHIRVSVVAMCGLVVALISTKSDLEENIKKVDFSILLFFAALFVAVGGLQYSGLLNHLSHVVTTVAKTNMLLCCIMVIWISAVTSAIVDNIPFTLAMIPIILGLGQELGDPHLVTPLWWALLIGVGLGGNGTHIGATANIIVVSLSEKTPTPITPLIWFKSALPVTVISLIVASLLFMIPFVFKYLSIPLY